MTQTTDQPKKRSGRPPLPAGEAKTHSLRTMVKPTVGKAFEKVCEERGLTVSAALAEAVLDWVRKPRG